MRIAILGTRGIPNNYGGFEQFAEYISTGLVKKGHHVTVYNPHFHPYKLTEFKGVNIIVINSPEEKIGSIANFVYDYKCLKDAAERNFDIIYEAGYATCSPFFYLLKSTNTRLITNMDGLEWKRSKWGFFAKRVMKFLEKLAVKRSHYLVSDNQGIQEYYRESFNKESFFIPYGADININHDRNDLSGFKVTADDFFIIIARMEPENNIDIILKAYQKSGRTEPLLVIGNYETKYGRLLYKKHNKNGIRFLGSIYNKKVLDSLRYYSKAYLHGHSVGGTNPSLLEAMASSCFIIAHQNLFNKSVLKRNGIYFESIETLKNIFINIDTIINHKIEFITNNLEEINLNYNWESIISKHSTIFEKIISESKVLKYKGKVVKFSA